jgi:quercetin dioxygenase-like cupin family protein
MFRGMTIALGLAAAACLAPAAAFAQEAPPTYQGDPAVYKVILEDQNFRVITATWKAGQTDKPHSHPVPSIAYSLNSCTLKLTAADGTVRIVKNKAGHAMTVPFVASHIAKNVGPTPCRVVLIERR